MEEQLSVTKVAEELFIDALKVSIDYSDLLFRLKINRNEFTKMYNHFVNGKGSGHISYDLLGYLKVINSGKIVENNYRYMVGSQYKDLKSLEIEGIIDEEILIEKARSLSSFKDYAISDDEILSRAKELGLEVKTTDELLNETRILILKSIPNKNLSVSELNRYIKPYDVIFDISSSDFAYLIKMAGLEIIY